MNENHIVQIDELKEKVPADHSTLYSSIVHLSNGKCFSCHETQDEVASALRQRELGGTPIYFKQCRKGLVLDEIDHLIEDTHFEDAKQRLRDARDKIDAIAKESVSAEAAVTAGLTIPELTDVGFVYY